MARAKHRQNRKGTSNLETLESRRLMASNPGQYFVPLPSLGGMQVASLVHTYADLNDDGMVDMLRGGGNSGLAVRFGKSYGDFANPVYYPTGTGNVDIETSDYNGDGHIDVFHVNANEKSINVLRGNGDGTLTSVNTVTFGDIRPTDTSVIDFTGDGKLDLVIVGFKNNFPLEGVIGTMVGNGDGTFGSLQTYSPIPNTLFTGPFGLGTADFTGDGRTDFVVGHNATQNGYQLYTNNGDGTFSKTGIMGTGAYMGYITVADFNSDGIGDWTSVATSTPQFGSSPPQNDMVIAIGNGDGTFSITAYQMDTDRDYMTGFANNVAVTDVDGDGHLDAAFTAQTASGPGASYIRILLGDGNGGFTYGAKVPSDNGYLQMPDINQDGAPDTMLTFGANALMPRMLASPTTTQFYGEPTKVYDGQPAELYAGVITVDDNYHANVDYLWYRAEDPDTALPASPTDVGDYIVKAIFAGDAHHAPSSATATYSITQATPTFTWTLPEYATYTGEPIEAFGVVTGVDFQVIANLEFSYYDASDTSFANPLLEAPSVRGSYVAIAHFAGNANYVAMDEMREYRIVSAESLVVTTLADESDANASPDLGNGTSLREALQYAEQHDGADTITFAPQLAGQTITLAEGNEGTALRVTSDVTIEGSGVTLSIAAGTGRRHMFLDWTGRLLLSNLTFINGDVSGPGGAISSSGVLTVRNCTFANNHASTDGGAIQAAFGMGSVILQNCTFAGNSAQEGSAISSGAPGSNWDYLTIVDNSTPFAGSGAVRLYINQVTLRNSIIARNTNDGLSTWAPGGGKFSSSSRNNVVGAGSWTGLNATTNKLNVNVASLKLGTLANNGGPTQTVALGRGSLAIGGGVPISGIDVDQRGVLRPIYGASDVGAFQRSRKDDAEPLASIRPAFNDASIFSDRRIVESIEGLMQ